jgi:hypothetical protein
MAKYRQPSQVTHSISAPPMLHTAGSGPGPSGPGSSQGPNSQTDSQVGGNQFRPPVGGLSGKATLFQIFSQRLLQSKFPSTTSQVKYSPQCFFSPFMIKSGMLRNYSVVVLLSLYVLE